MNAPGRTESILYALFVLGLLLPWLWIQINLSINVDIAFLTQSAVYLLDGERMTDAYYDTNPPLSILIYVIPAAITKYGGVPLIYATLGYNMFLVALSAILLHAVLKPFTTLSPVQKSVLLGVYILSNTVAANLYLGEKDQYILLALFPFTLLQLAMTRKLPVAGWAQILTTALAAIFLMVKPHFYIVPALMLAHRIWVQKRQTALFDRDILALAAAIIVYAALLLFWFDDFTTMILPDILTLYASIKEPWVTEVFMMATAAIGIIALPAALLFKTPNKFVMLLLLIGWLCMIPFIIQGKGYYYHMIPAIVFVCCAAALLLSDLIAQPLAKSSKECAAQRTGLYATTLAFALSFYAIFLPYGKSPALTHAEYREMPLTKLVIEACENRPACTFFLFNDMTEIIHQTSVYSQIRQASRFSVFWFLPVIANKENKTLPQGKKEELARKYSAMVAADLQRFKPRILIIGRFEVEAPGKIFDFKDFFSSHSNKISEELAHYAYDRTISLNLQTYFPGTLVADHVVSYDIFRRTE
ncbi:MAG: hypothetical protein KJ017_06575 [Alphaproteobacteria bacterium]|nr:hypothetical protein [Alphaproteobacteria bacterium]